MTQRPDEFSWSEKLALSIAREVRRHRQEQGLSAQQLSDRCGELGMPIQRSVLANLESGRRATITMAEVLVLAAALGVAPAQLVFPVGYTDQVEVLPNRTTDPSTAIEWFSGERHLNRRVVAAMSTPIAAFNWHARNVEFLRRALRRRNEGLRQYVEIQENREELRARAAELREEMKPLDETVVGYRESMRGIPIRERPPRRPEVLEARDRLSELRSEEQSIRRQLDAARYLKDSLQHSDSEVATFGGRLIAIRRRMKESGWEPPPVPKDVAEYVKEAPWQMFLEPREEGPDEERAVDLDTQLLLDRYEEEHGLQDEDLRRVGRKLTDGPEGPPA